MAWFKCIGKDGYSLVASPLYISYLKWKITKVKDEHPAGGYMQAAEFNLYQNGVKYIWKQNATATSNMAGETGQEVSHIIDGTTDKYCTPAWGDTQFNECEIVISLGEMINLNANSTYSYLTAEDEASRDPISWEIYGSPDGSTWIRLDVRQNVTISDNRNIETFFPLAFLGKEESLIQHASGSFTTGSQQSQEVEINCGFRPDYISVDMEFESGHTCAIYEKTSNGYETSRWDLRPIENVIYYPFDGVETGISAITNTGFKYRCYSTNTQNKKCTYNAIKFM